VSNGQLAPQMVRDNGRQFMGGAIAYPAVNGQVNQSAPVVFDKEALAG
jgi:hypothetical protein